MSDNPVQYLFRKPRYPLICVIEGDVFAAKSHAGFQKQLETLNLPPDKHYNMIDVTAKGWTFVSGFNVISELSSLRSQLVGHGSIRLRRITMTRGSP